MKILFLLTADSLMNSLNPLVNKLKARGHQVTFLAHAGNKPVNWHHFEFKQIEAFSPDRVIVWNGRFRHLNAAFEAIRQRYKTLIVEMAWLPQSENHYLSDDISARADFLKGETREPDFGVVQRLRARYQVKRKPPFSDYMLVPLQLEVDTSILYFSPYFKCMHNLIGFARQYSPRPIVIKKHPKEKITFDRQGLIVIENEFTMNELAANCRFVMGINSTSMIEAMIHYKPILAYGKNVATAICPAIIQGTQLTKQEMDDAASLDIIGDPIRKRQYDRCLTHLAANQYLWKDPPSWVIQKIES